MLWVTRVCSTGTQFSSLPAAWARVMMVFFSFSLPAEIQMLPTEVFPGGDCVPASVVRRARVDGFRVCMVAPRARRALCTGRSAAQRAAMMESSDGVPVRTLRRARAFAVQASSPALRVGWSAWVDCVRFSGAGSVYGLCCDLQLTKSVRHRRPCIQLPFATLDEAAPLHETQHPCQDMLWHVRRSCRVC